MWQSTTENITEVNTEQLTILIKQFEFESNLKIICIVYGKHDLHDYSVI